MSNRHANRLIESSEVVANLGPMGPVPQSERQARPLAKLPAEEQAPAWKEAVETAEAEAAAQTRRLLHGHLAAPSAAHDCTRRQPAPRLPATVQPPPPHSARRWRAPAPFVRRGRTAGGGRRAPRTATEQDRCGSGKVAANESGGASGTRVSLPFPPPFEPPSHPLTFVRTHTRGEGRGKTHGGLLSCYRPPALRGAGLTAAPPHPPCAVAPRGGALVPV